MFSERVADSIRKGREVAVFGSVTPTGAGTLYASRGLGNSATANQGQTGPSCQNAVGHCDVLAGGYGGINMLDVANLYRKFVGVSSRHSGGVNTARGDGSVHFIAETITLARNNNNTVANLADDTDGDLLVHFQQQIVPKETWRQLIALNDGTTVNDDPNQQ
jgi:prepilin-type processing-associated H-X9-DG protein